MAAYRGTEAYDLSLFETQIVKQKPIPLKTPGSQKGEPEVQARPRANAKTAQRREEIHALRLKLKACACLTVGLACVAAVLCSYSQSDELTREMASVNKQIGIAQSENVRLNAEMTSRISIDKVESYAEDVLGMVKVDSYQITYLDMSAGDQIVLSGDKTAAKSNLSAKLRNLFAYLG